VGRERREEKRGKRRKRRGKEGEKREGDGQTYEDLTGCAPFNLGYATVNHPEFVIFQASGARAQAEYVRLL